MKIGYNHSRTQNGHSIKILSWHTLLVYHSSEFQFLPIIQLRHFPTWKYIESAGSYAWSGKGYSMALTSS